MSRTYLSKKGYEKLKKKLDYLVNTKKPQIVERIKTAAGHGDLSENFEYDSAKEALTQLMQKIQIIRVKLSQADIIEENKIDTDKVVLGSTIYLKEMNSGNEMKYSLVVEDQVDPMEDKISVNSPIAQGLLGKKEGEKAEIDIPAGTVKFQIEKVTREDL